MKRSNPFHILLVNPPVASPAAPPWGPAQATAHLQGPGMSIETYDANLDFYLNVCLNRERLGLWRGRAEARAKRGEGEGLGSETMERLSDLTADPEKWDRKIGEIEKTLNALRTQVFYRPETFMGAMESIHDLLALVSLAHVPFSVQWGSCSCLPAKDAQAMRRFAEDEGGNPFLALCRKALPSRLKRSHLKCVVFFVSGPAQIPAALTMARFIGKRDPRPHMVLVGDAERDEGAAAYVDTVLPETEMELLVDRIENLGGHPPPFSERDPDFQGMPLEAYLAPAPVLPVEAVVGPFSDFLERQAREYGAKGFLCKDHGMIPSRLADGTGDPAGGDPGFCLSLSCALSASSFSEEPEAVHLPGLKVIRWRDPSGPMESLTPILLGGAKAGIWNHLEGPSTRLVHFAASNPNIVHSRIRIRPLRFPCQAPVEDAEEEPEVYSQVAKLPGRPFWRFLEDPAHLLLQVDRHGLRKVLRWRAREDLSALYSLGENMAYHFVPPQDLPPGYLDEICRMVEAGGSVGGRWVRYNLERAFLIAYVVEEGVIVANSSLKRPRQEYVDAVNRQCGLDLSTYLERGYTSVRPEYRGMGIGTRLLEGLTARVGDKKLFSVISEDNLATQKIALRNRTRRVAAFTSERTGKRIGIWIPEWMLEASSGT